MEHQDYAPDADEFAHAVDVKEAREMVLSELEMRLDTKRDLEGEAASTPLTSAYERLDLVALAIDQDVDARACARVAILLDQRLRDLTDGWTAETLGRLHQPAA